MSRAAWRATRNLTLLLLYALTPQLLRAQVVLPYFMPEYSLGANTSGNWTTTVVSSARVTLYNGSNGQQLTSQVIMGHGVADLTANTAIYEKRVVSEIGDARNTVSLNGVLYHCYEVNVAGHANAYNLHQIWGYGPICAEPYEPPPGPEIPEENCPVLLDLKQDGFHLSGPEPPVSFDVDADGVPDDIAWTQAGEDEAFLCLDRNGNGAIDDGRELFGYATPLLSGERAVVGYRALADLDQPALGGDQNGKVDSRDQLFRDLCAWVDSNRDGVSQTSEIRTLPEVGVVALAYSYRTTGLRDSFGNLFRYVSRVDMRSSSGAVTSWPTFDVIFTEP